MTWFFFPIKSTDTSGVKTANTTTWLLQNSIWDSFLQSDNSTSLVIIRIVIKNDKPCYIVYIIPLVSLTNQRKQPRLWHVLTQFSTSALENMGVVLYNKGIKW